jgi:mRNA interferase YafQ
MTMLTFEPTAKFNRDIKRMIRRKLDLSPMDAVIQTLLEEKPLARRYKDHALTGDYKGFRECHILPDWLLIYAVDKGNLILIAARTGSHSDLF